MRPKLIAFVAALQCVNSALLGEYCNDEVPCTPLDDTQCSKDGPFSSSHCLYGICTCLKDFTANNRSYCYNIRKLHIGEACGEFTTCNYPRGECVGEVCDCSSGESYRSRIDGCVPTQEKLLGEECTVVNECFDRAPVPAVRCVANTGTTTPKYCRCKEGYVFDKRARHCRLPAADEICLTTVGCESILKHNNDGSFVLLTLEDETCVENICVCPETSIKLTSISVFHFGITSLKMCQEKYSGTLKNEGDICTESSQCSTHYCQSCPGEDQRKCIQPPAYIFTDECSSAAQTVPAPSRRPIDPPPFSNGNNRPPP